MAPIPTYNATPLHPQGVTPRTASIDENAFGPPPTRTTAEPTAAVASSYPPPPQPGARPVAPDASRSRPTSYIPSPPAPQPGLYAPPPPKVTATHTTTATYLGGPVSPPRQMSLSAPGQNYAPTHSTSIYQPVSPLGSSFPASAFAGGPVGAQPSPYGPGSRSNSVYSRSGSVSEGPVRHSLEHPPGYVQNPYAADGTAEERARWADMARRESADKGVLGSVRTAFGSVGDGLKKTEESAWRWFGSKN